MVLEEKGPEREKLIVPADRFGFAHRISAEGRCLAIHPGQWPEFPSGQTIAVAQVKDWIKIIVCDYVLFARLRIEREHNELDIVPKHPIFQVSEERKERRVVLVALR